MSNEELPAGTADEKTTKADVPTSHPTIGNTHVEPNPRTSGNNKVGLMM